MPPSPSTPEPEPPAAANPVPEPAPAPSSSSLFRNRSTSHLPPPPTASPLPPAAAASLASSNDEGPGLTSRGQPTPISSLPSEKSAAAPKRRSVSKEVRDEVTDLCHDGVKTISGVLHHVFTFRNKAERDAGVWIADTEQAARIAEPAAELVLTHVPDQWLKTTFVQGLRLLFGVGSYVEDHLATKADLRFNPPQVIPGKAVSADA